MSKRIFLVSVAVLLSMGCGTREKREITQFSYLGKPINPAVVESLYNSDGQTLDLRALETDVQFGDWEERPGWLIARQKEDPGSGRAPFFAYRLLMDRDDRFLLATTNGGGGTGVFDNILVVRKTADRLSILENFGEGDRCNGGIADLRVEQSGLSFSRNITPVDMIGLATEPKLDVVPYEDLEGSANSCFGTANYRYSLDEGRLEFVSVSLSSQEIKDENDWTERYVLQSCFNRVYNTYVKAGKTELSPGNLNEFAAKFQEECLKPKD